MPKYSYVETLNDNETYDFLFEPRGIPYAIQYRTKTFSKKIQSVNIRVYQHTWKQGDKLYKLAAQYYGNFQRWWIIAMANQLTSEADLYYGAVIAIPINPNDIIDNI